MVPWEDDRHGTSLHLCHNWWGWCFLQYQFLSGQGLHSPIQGGVFSVQRKVLEGQLHLKLSTQWIYQLWTCNSACSAGLSERISPLLANASYCLLSIFYVCFPVSLLWFCMDCFSMVVCQDSFTAESNDSTVAWLMNVLSGTFVTYTALEPARHFNFSLLSSGFAFFLGTMQCKSL